ncbi:unnamed protein product [Phytomonas sp. EM1]|nr:unnamed protein product [Phytomonas sp. EM1]|eukprot:CCW61055.1 unnamed protein product [Phytomonas sp. isolate EM1]
MTRVVELTPENFDEYVNPEANRYTFVLFCTPWARPCKHVSETWDIFSISQSKKKLREIFTAARVDAKKYPELAKRMEVNSFPTLKYYTPDFPDGLEYHGQREVALLDSFVFQFS